MPFCFLVGYFSQKGLNNSGLYFGNQPGFSGYIDYTFLNHLKNCSRYTTPAYIHAPIFISTYRSKTRIIGKENNFCKVQNLKWELNKKKAVKEYYIPISYAKLISEDIILELKSSNEKVNFSHINLGLNYFSKLHMIKELKFKKTEYNALSQNECKKYKKKLGLKSCPYDNDYFAGAVLACKHISKVPSPDDLTLLASTIYNNPSKLKYVTIVEDVNSRIYSDLGLETFSSKENVFYWSNEESENFKVKSRMFGHGASNIRFIPRNGGKYLDIGKISLLCKQ